ncbi:hypothetical protein LTR95_015988, partial [Oleoguttula sp. CCFEE 5521]
AGPEGLKRHMGDDDINCQILDAFWENRAADYHEYRPFKEWPDAKDVDLVDLITKLTNLDPGQRLTAEEALEHPWFNTTNDLKASS